MPSGFLSFSSYLAVSFFASCLFDTHLSNYDIHLIALFRGVLASFHTFLLSSSFSLILPNHPYTYPKFLSFFLSLSPHFLSVWPSCVALLSTVYLLSVTISFSLSTRMFRVLFSLSVNFRSPRLFNASPLFLVLRFTLPSSLFFSPSI